VAKYAQDAPKTEYQEYNNVSYNSGNTGVQFGAFSTYESATAQATRVKNITGFSPKIEKNQNGLYRVRVMGLSENAAINAKNTAVANGIDCFIFH